MAGGGVLEPKTTREGKDHDPSDEGHDKNGHPARAIAGAVAGRRRDARAGARDRAGSTRSGEGRGARGDQGERTGTAAAIAVATTGENPRRSSARWNGTCRRIVAGCFAPWCSRGLLSHRATRSRVGALHAPAALRGVGLPDLRLSGTTYTDTTCLPVCDEIGRLNSLSLPLQPPQKLTN